MRKTIITSLALLASVCASGQNIKVIEDINPLDEKSFEKSLGSDWAEIDSLVILECSYTFKENDFAFIRKCCEEGRLSGIDLRMAWMRDIPSLAFSPSASSDGTKRQSKLKYVTLPAGLKTIGRSAFAGTDLVMIDIPRTVVSIGPDAFGGCSGLRSVTLRGNVPISGISPDAFAGSASDAVLNVSPETADSYRSGIGRNFKAVYGVDNIFKTVSLHFDGSLTAREMLGPDSSCVDSLVVTGIPTNDDLLYIMTLPTSGKGRLYGLNLYDCEMDEIPVHGFYGPLNRVKHLVLPKSLKKIGGDSFSTTYIGWISIPGTIEEIGWAAFRSCYDLSLDLFIPEGVKFIGEDAFYNCYNLKSIHLPSTLSRLGVHSFYMPFEHGKGHDVYMNRMTPPESVYYDDGVYSDEEEYAGGPFGFIISSYGAGWRLFVPLGARAAYEAHPHWKHFGEIVETPELTGGPNAVEGVTAPDNGNGVSEVYTLSGRLVWRGSGTPSLQKGLYIVKENGRAVKRIVE